MEEEALLTSRRDDCADISFKRWILGGVKGECDPKTRPLSVEMSLSCISRNNGREMEWDGMNPHVHIAFEYANMYIPGITLGRNER